jgi:hypothetical protein
MRNIFEVAGSLFSKPQPKRSGMCHLQIIYEISRMQTLPGVKVDINIKPQLKDCVRKVD